jgi:hypothetical protein
MHLNGRQILLIAVAFGVVFSVIYGGALFSDGYGIEISLFFGGVTFVTAFSIAALGFWVLMLFERRPRE